MLFDNYQFSDTESRAYQKGLREGIEYVDVALKKATKQLHKTAKMNIAETLATTTTFTNHKCNCEFCRFND